MQTNPCHRVQVIRAGKTSVPTDNSDQLLSVMGALDECSGFCNSGRWKRWASTDTADLSSLAHHREHQAQTLSLLALRSYSPSRGLWVRCWPPWLPFLSLGDGCFIPRLCTWQS
ncbi:uncharacterized protein LOC143443604 [Arvicanthis niloticus]|uniref:uncharacterized protein LOC143443604 n=1 Tax=Arvicanthis niloticus TaxID=61156 RepID=UPI00403C3BDF